MDDDADTLDARISSECPVEAQAILRSSWRHDVDALKPLLRGPGQASVRDPITGETPLHAAIRSATAETEEAAAQTVQRLLTSGAIWNDVDDHNETPGCVAWRRGRSTLYELCVSAGMRAEMLFAVLDGYEALSSGDDEEEEEEEEEGGEEADDADEAEAENGEAEPSTANADNGEAEAAATAATTEEPYLESHLTLADGKLVDAAGNGVMMDWEADIMRRSVDALLGSDPAAGQGKRVLNIGFGLGIIDSLLAARRPARHHIIEAHPDVLARLGEASSSGAAAATTAAATAATTTAATAGDHAAEFGPAWEAAGPEMGAFQVHRGRWQDICPMLLTQGELYDAIYFDTFGEDYTQLHRFFSDYIPGLLADDGVFGFFHGLGADRRICYDVYTRVVELHLSEAGLDVEWRDVAVPLADSGLAEPGKGAWQGIIRPYWTLEKYRLPVCTFMG